MPLNVLLVESFYGGSHAAFADGLARHSRHTITLVTLPAQNWRWRTRIAAFELAAQVPDPQRYDVALVTDLIDLGDLRAIWGRSCPPVLLYVHESQLTYPHPKDRNPDMNTALQDIKNCLLADGVLFNSQFHRSEFLKSTRELVSRVPGEQPLTWHDTLRDKSGVLYPGIETDMLVGRPAHRIPRVLWSHRWEYDKRPRPFFRALAALAKEEVPFEVVVLGENPQLKPVEFLNGKQALADRIIRWGYVESRREYWNWLCACDVVVSTAIQENFGIAMVEAILAGCQPLLPRRLSYPEIVPAEFHQSVLYDSHAELTVRLRTLLQSIDPRQPGNAQLSAAMQRYAWPVLALRYDDELTKIRLHRAS